MKSRKALTIGSLLLLTLLFVTPWPAAADLANQQAALTEINFPDNNAVVRGVISIRGSATHPSFDRFQVAYAREPIAGNNAWVTIGIERRDQVVNNELAIWNTNQVPDGSYSLRLRVIRVDGNYNEIEVKQIVVANSQPAETPTPEEAPAAAQPTITPTPLPPTPTVVIEQPVVDTPTPRPLAQVAELPTPRPTNASLIPIPEVEIDTAPFRGSCLWGAGAMLGLFLFFGFLSALRIFIMGFIDRTRTRRR